MLLCGVFFSSAKESCCVLLTSFVFIFCVSKVLPNLHDIFYSITFTLFALLFPFIFVMLYCATFDFSCSSTLIIFISLSIAFRFSFLFHFNLLQKVTSLISICGFLQFFLTSDKRCFYTDFVVDLLILV